MSLEQCRKKMSRALKIAERAAPVRRTGRCFSAIGWNSSGLRRLRSRRAPMEPPSVDGCPGSSHRAWPATSMPSESYTITPSSITAARHGHTMAPTALDRGRVGLDRVPQNQGSAADPSSSSEQDGRRVGRRSGKRKALAHAAHHQRRDHRLGAPEGEQFRRPDHAVGADRTDAPGFRSRSGAGAYPCPSRRRDASWPAR